MSTTTTDRRTTSLSSPSPSSRLPDLFDCGTLLLAYAVSGVVETAARSLDIPAGSLETALRSGRSLREVAHDLDHDPGDLQLALARGAQTVWIDDRAAGELIAASARLLDLPLYLGPP
jgi:hypothetical protein